MLLNRFHPRFRRQHYFFPSINGFFSPHLIFLRTQEDCFSATYCSFSDSGNAKYREAVGTCGTSFCSIMRHLSCCLLKVSHVAALWLSHDWLVHRQAGVLGLFQREKKTPDLGKHADCQSAGLLRAVRCTHQFADVMAASKACVGHPEQRPALSVCSHHWGLLCSSAHRLLQSLFAAGPLQSFALCLFSAAGGF